MNGIEPSTPGIQSFVERFVVSGKSEEGAGSTQKETKADKDGRWNGEVVPISAPTILICSHNSRDSRCGILGPILHQEFVQYINKRHALRNQPTADVVNHNGQQSEDAISYASHPSFHPHLNNAHNENKLAVNVGMVSHIGGHKWAGNVIVYIPPDYETQPLERQARGANPHDEVASEEREPIVSEESTLSSEQINRGISPLAGKGIWYGRVEPKHVEGIVEQTIGHGKIIKELFRGGLNRNGSTLRI